MLNNQVVGTLYGHLVGRDNDNTAAGAGGLVWLIFGIDDIPADLRADVHLDTDGRAMLESFASRLHG